MNQPLVEVETAKATVEIPSPFAGTRDDVARVGGRRGAGRLAVGHVRRSPTSGASSPSGRARASPVKAAATPAVRKLAKERGIDLATITGTGPGGRITVEDLDAAGGWGLDVVGVEPITPVRREIARRLTEVAAIPQVTTFRTVDCTALEAFRRERDVSPLPVFIAALARISPDHPLLNSSWQADGIHASGSVHVGLAIDTERGLMVPVLRNAHSMGIAGIASEIRRLAEAARGGHLHAERPPRSHDRREQHRELRLRGRDAPPQSRATRVTVAMGVIQPRALVVDGEVVARPACTLSLTFDHRVMDGATAGRALTDLVSLLQDGERLRDLPA